MTPAGTGAKAAVAGYRVAGKTGTAWKAVSGGYSTDRYLSVFAGVVPATQPRLAVVVMVDEPQGVLLLRWRRRRAGVLGGHLGRAAPHVGGAGRPCARDAARDTGGRPVTARLALDELLAGVAPAPQALIAGLTLDSRAVAPGDAFVALRADTRPWARPCAEAIARGARAVLWDPPEGREPGAAGAEIPS